MSPTSARLWLRPPRWSPIAVGLVAAIGVLWLWRGLTEREVTQLVTRADIASDASSRAIDRQFGAIRAAVSRVATFSMTAGPGSEHFGATTERLVAETDGLDRLLVIDERGLVRRVAPANSPVVASPQLRRAVDSLLSRFRVRDRLTGDGAAPPSMTSAIGLTDAPWGIAVIQPVRSRLDGISAVVGLIDERTLLQEFTADTGAGFAIRAFAADSELVGDPVSATPPVLESEIALGTRVIRLTLTPKAGAHPSRLPDLVLALGLAIAALLALTLWLARKTYEEASAVGMSRMQRAIERATDGVWELELPSQNAHRSQALLRSLGLDPAHVNGSPDAWNSRIHPDDRDTVRESLAHHLVGHSETFESEYRIRAGDGDWHTIVDRGRVIERGRDGRPRRMLGISADITERARTEAAREESERRFRVMFETAHQLQLLIALDGHILEANLAAEALAGATVLKGHAFAMLPWWRSEDRALIQERLARAGSGDANRFEAMLWIDEDRNAFVDFSLKPIRDHESRVVQVLVEGRDLTERRRVEASLREIGALTTMGLLAARVAHEINNPLAGIQNAFLLVRGAIPTDHPHYRFVGAIEREIARIAAVTRQLYETYRPDQAMASTSSVILAIGDAITFLEQVNRTRDVHIVTDVSRAPSLVPVPDALLRQALYNLVQNAVDASPPGGTIQVLAGLEDGWCVVRVMDEGPGIPTELHHRIFDPFFTTKDRSVKTGGMGIGLSLVHQSVTAVGGSIAVRLRESGGTEFCVRLPMIPIDTGVLR